MPKKKNSKKTAQAAFISRLLTSRVVVAAILVVTCGVAGTVWLVTSDAAPKPPYCLAHEYWEYKSGTWGGYCVKDIQTMLNYSTVHLRPEHYKGTQLTVDGEFGPGTLTQVETFQKFVGPVLQVDGVVGAHTWEKLCEFTNSAKTGDAKAAFKSAGCTYYHLTAS